MGSVLALSTVVGPTPTAQGTSFGDSSRLHVQSNRSAANRAFYGHVLPSMRVGTWWTGRVSSCRPGTISSGARRAALDMVNTYRRMSGLRAVSFTSTLSARAQRAALMMEAAGTLSHTPDRSWPCWTASGDAAAQRSNLALLYSGRLAVPAYMAEPGSSNREVGHRRWILDPRQVRMGIGQTRHVNALYLLDTSSWSWQSGARPFTAWPTAGYFPVAMEPRGRWSLTTARSAYDLRRARVTVSGPSGRLGLTTYRERSVISWDLSAPISRGFARDRVYTVTVSNILRRGTAISPLRYKVVLVPLRRLRATEVPSVGGASARRASSGTVLVADRGSWTPSPEVGRYTYQWLRDGVPIRDANGSSYTVHAADSGRLLSVRVSALPRSANYRRGTATSTGG
jgi:uncharacterized protein YkwD